MRMLNVNMMSGNRGKNDHIRLSQQVRGFLKSNNLIF